MTDSQSLQRERPQVIADLFVKCLKSIDKKDRFVVRALIKKGEILDFWEEKARFLPEFSSYAKPEVGVLRLFGYSVGKWSYAWNADDNVRRLILREFLSTNRLPPVKDKGYLAWWGGPWSAKRFEALDQFFQSQISEHQSNSEMKVAVSRWQADWVYIRSLSYSEIG